METEFGSNCFYGNVVIVVNPNDSSNDRLQGLFEGI